MRLPCGVHLGLAALHVGGPELEVAAPLRVPVPVEVEQQVDPPAPVLVDVVGGEVGVHVEVAAGEAAVQAAAVEAQVGDQVVEAGERAEEGDEAVGGEGLGHLLEHRPPRGRASVLAYLRSLTCRYLRQVSSPMASNST